MSVIKIRTSEKLTTPDAWREWRRVCALDLCGGESSAQLRRFGKLRFSALLNRCAVASGRFPGAARAVDVESAWHLLETRAQTGNSRSGKRYKDWMFDRIDEQPDELTWLDRMESRASLIMRDSVRAHLRHEYAPAFMTSLYQPVRHDGKQQLTLEDLIPDDDDPFANTAEAEHRTTAERLAGTFFLKLTFEQRACFWVRARGLPLSDPRVLTWVQRSRDFLYRTHQEAITQMAHTITDAIPAASPSEKTAMARLVLELVNDHIDAKIYREKRTARFFKKLEGHE